MVAHYVSPLVNETSSVAGEGPASGVGMKITPGVHPIKVRHSPILSLLQRERFIMAS